MNIYSKHNSIRIRKSLLLNIFIIFVEHLHLYYLYYYYYYYYFHLNNKHNNEVMYIARLSDELIRYTRIRSYMFDRKIFLTFSNIGYNLRDNEIIALEAIKNTIYSFDFISTRLKNDKHFLFNAFQLNPNLYLIDMDISNKNFIKKIRDISINIFDLDFMKENAFYLDKFKNFKDIINYLINKNKFEIICLNNNLVNFISENLNNYKSFFYYLCYYCRYDIIYNNKNLTNYLLSI